MLYYILAGISIYYILPWNLNSKFLLFNIILISFLNIVVLRGGGGSKVRKVGNMILR